MPLLLGSKEIFLPGHPCLFHWFISSLVTSVVFLSPSIIYAFTVIYPILNVGESASQIFFAHIAKRVHPEANASEIASAEKSFLRDVTTASDEEFAADVGRQVFANARVAWKKYRRTAISIRWLIASLVPWALSFIFVGVGKWN